MAFLAGVLVAAVAFAVGLRRAIALQRLCRRIMDWTAER